MLYRETYDVYNKHRSFLRNAHCKLQGVCVGVADVLYLVFAFFIYTYLLRLAAAHDHAKWVRQDRGNATGGGSER